jgi:hypothetical protein
MKTLCLLLTGATLACAQSMIYLGAGPSMHAYLPYGAANVTVGLCTSDVTTCALLNYQARGYSFLPSTLEYTSTAGVRQVIGSAWSARGHVDLFLLGEAGATITTSSTGFSGAGGGGLTAHLARFPRWSASIAAEAEYSPVNPGWRPQAFVQFGYLFKGR